MSAYYDVLYPQKINGPFDCTPAARIPQANAIAQVAMNENLGPLNICESIRFRYEGIGTAYPQNIFFWFLGSGVGVPGRWRGWWRRGLTGELEEIWLDGVDGVGKRG